MAGKVLSIELGSVKTKLCVLAYNNRTQSVSIDTCLLLDTPAGVVTDSGIHGIDNVASMIGLALRENNIRVKECIFVINSSEVMNKIITLPKQKSNKEYMQLIEADDTLFPVDMRNSLFTYSLLNKITDELYDKKNKKFKKIVKYESLVYACERDIIDSYLELAKILKLHVNYIDYVGNSVYNLVLKENTGSDFLIIHMSDFSCILSIVSGGRLVLQRVVDFSLVVLGERIVQRDAVFKIDSIEDAFSYININNFLDSSYKLPSYDDGYSELDIEDIERTRDDLIELISSFFSSIESFLSFYRKDGKDVEKVIFVNQSYNLDSLSDSIAQMLNRGVEVFDTNKYISKNRTGVDLNPFIGCIGALINPVNFNIVNSEVERKNKIADRYILYMLVFSVAISCSLVLLSVVKNETLKQENEVLKTKIAEAERAREIYNTWVSSVNNLEISKTFDTSSKTVLNDLDIVLDKIAQILPTNKCKIGNISSDNTVMTLSVITDTKDTMAKLVQGLESINEYFVKVDLDSVSDSEGETFSSKREVSATIQCYFEYEDSNIDTVETSLGGEGDNYGQVTQIESEYDYTNPDSEFGQDDVEVVDESNDLKDSVEYINPEE